MSKKFDIAVIGSGPGGYAAAIRCAQRGASVALIEKSHIGGTCLNCGCVPSKALLASAHTLLSVRNAVTMGVDVASATANWAKMQARKDTIVTGFRKGLAGLIQSNRIEVLKGRGVVTAPNIIRVETDAAPIDIEADKIILATGSQPVQLQTLPFDGQTIISSKEALELQEMPKSMAIIGGGVIGCEFACLYAALATKVTIVEALPHLIPAEDEWVGRLIEREFKKLGIDVFTEQEVSSVKKDNGLAKVNLKDGQALDAEKVLVAVGRKPVCDKETVEVLDLKTKDSAIIVDEQMQTNVAGIYAVGDTVGTTYLAHGAFAEAAVAAANTTGGNEEIGNYSLIPRAIYTFPEIASVGKTKKNCESEGLDVSMGTASFKANSRSVAHNETIGQIRVIRSNATDRIIGVTMVGATVTELIAAARALIGSAERIAETSFPHPTASEVLKEAVEDAFGLSLHNPPKALREHEC
jgi:dihydrolipoamide dehydrogenase